MLLMHRWPKYVILPDYMVKTKEVSWSSGRPSSDALHSTKGLCVFDNKVNTATPQCVDNHMLEELKSNHSRNAKNPTRIAIGIVCSYHTLRTILLLSVENVSRCSQIEGMDAVVYVLQSAGECVSESVTFWSRRNIEQNSGIDRQPVTAHVNRSTKVCPRPTTPVASMSSNPQNLCPFYS